MAVDATTSATSTNSTSSTSSSKAATAAQKAGVNYNDFLQLLIAQMKNQDPTSPMDASQQISQLATFSQVEQSIQTNSNLENLIQQQGINQAASYIGKTITSSDGGTTGVVKSVRVASDGVTATTVAGAQIKIESGITVSQN